MKKRSFRNILTAVLIVCFAALAVFAGWQIYSILHSTSTAKQVYESIAEQAGTAGENEDPLTRSMDWDTLRENYPGIVGWISCPDTEIDYPIMQAADNDYYLRHLADGTYNKHGTLFLDCEQDGTFNEWNSIVYGHNMKDGTMLACLLNYQAQAYYDEHPVMYLYTPPANYILEVLSGYITDDVSDAYQWGGTADDHRDWLQTIEARSYFTHNELTVSEAKVLTLSTCVNGTDNSDKRYVLHLSMAPMGQ